MNLLKLKKNKAGFTLVELLIVIVILGIIAALVLPRLVSQPEKARVAEAGNTLGIIGRALQATSQMRGNVWLDLSAANNQAAIGIQDPNADTSLAWIYSSNNAANVVRAARRANNNMPTGASGCTAGDYIELNTTNGTYTGTGCYGASNNYAANVILKGQ